MNSSNSRIAHLFDLLKKGDFKFIWEGITKRIWSKSEAFGLRRDLNLDFKNPDALIEISIREFRKDDDDHFESDRTNKGLVERNIPTSYVAVTNEDIPCYRQWLMGPDQNEKIRNFWGNAFPVLEKDEALLESAFTNPAFRGKRIMTAAMSRIAEKGNDLGVRYVNTFVDIHNIPSLKGCKRSGFYPYILRKERWILFNKSVTFTDVPEDRLELFDEYTGPSK